MSDTKKRPPRFIHWRPSPVGMTYQPFAPAACGTRGGLMEERRANEVTCPECLAVMAMAKT